MNGETVARWDILTRVCGLGLHLGGALGAFFVLPLALGVPVVAAFVVGGVRAWRIAVVIDDRNLTLRNWGRTHVVPWSAITGWGTAGDHLMVEVNGKMLYMEGTKQFPLPQRRATRRLDSILTRLVQKLRAVEGAA